MEKKENIVLISKPELRRPYMICGISGWVDGGEVATGGVKYLVKKIGAEKFAEIPIARYHIYQIPGGISLRPHVKMDNGIVKEHYFPRNQFYYWLNPNAEHDLILFRGTEPNLNWEEYVNTILDFAREYSVARIYLLGGVLDETPHTREPKVSCACTSSALRDEIQKYKVQFSNYEGPGSFSTTMLYFCQQRGIDAVSFTSRATYYPEFDIVIPRNPKSIRTVIRRLNHLLSLNLDFSDLDKEAREFEGKLDFMASQNSRFRSYVEELEKNYVEMIYEEPLEISADEAIKFAEEFLKHPQQE
ncbi:MAG: PAC2 family protein [Chloroflexota bacterium]